MGAALALPLAADRKPAALVLASPFLGHFATPSWCPVSFDSLVGPLSRVSRRIFVDEDLRGRRYTTESLHALRQCRDLARGADYAATGVACPTMVLVGAKDAVVTPKSTLDWTAAHLPRAEIRAYDASGHDLFHDADARKATDDVVAFLAKNANR